MQHFLYATDFFCSINYEFSFCKILRSIFADPRPFLQLLNFYSFFVWNESLSEIMTHICHYFGDERPIKWEKIKLAPFCINSNFIWTKPQRQLRKIILGDAYGFLNWPNVGQWLVTIWSFEIRPIRFHRRVDWIFSRSSFLEIWWKVWREKFNIQILGPILVRGSPIQNLVKRNYQKHIESLLWINYPVHTSDL